MTDSYIRQRRLQAAKVMPLIGQLLDAWDGIPNDLKGEIISSSVSFHQTIMQINDAMEEQND